MIKRSSARASVELQHWICARVRSRALPTLCCAFFRSTAPSLIVAHMCALRVVIRNQFRDFKTPISQPLLRIRTSTHSRMCTHLQTRPAQPPRAPSLEHETGLLASCGKFECLKGQSKDEQRSIAKAYAPIRAWQGTARLQRTTKLQVHEHAQDVDRQRSQRQHKVVAESMQRDRLRRN